MLDATDTLGLPLLGRASLGGGPDGMHASRVLPTPTGAWVLGTELTPDPEARCPGTPAAYGSAGSVTLFDTRTASDPVRIGGLPMPVDVFGAALAHGRAFVVTGRHEGLFFCPPEPYDPMKLPPPPETSLTGSASGEHARNVPGEPPSGSLLVYTSARPGASVEASLLFPYSLTDVVVVSDVAIVAAAEYGLLFVDVSDPAHPRKLDMASIPFDMTLSNRPGHPQRLRLLGDLLFVSAADGGVVLVDVSEPRAPKLVSGGNVEPAWDSAAVADRLLLASRDRLTELSVPFLYVTGYSPARESLVAPEGVELVVRFNRPLAASSFTDATVRLLGANDAAVDVDLEVSGSTLVVRPESALAANMAYRLEVDSRVTDQRGGALLVPLRLGFRTGAAGSRMPVLASVAPAAASRAGGTVLTVQGQRLGGVAQVRVGGQPATFQVISETEVRVTAPAMAEAGPADLEVVDQGGPTAVLPSAVLYLDPLEGAGVALTPDHGPVEGGTRVRLAVSGLQALSPGTRVRIGGRDAVDVDVEDLSSLSFTTPAVDDATLAPVELVRPGEAPVRVGLFSYDLPVGTTLDLPGFPPKVASELRLLGDTLYVGVSNSGHEGLELFDVRLEERPIRLGGVRTERPVRGLDVSGALAYLATDELGLVVVDVSAPEFPFIAERAVTYGRATGVRLEGADAYVSVTDASGSPGVIQRFHAVGPRLSPPQSVVLDADALALDLGPDRFYALTSQVVGGAGSGLALTIYDRAGTRVGRTTVLSGTRPYEELVSSRLAVRGSRAYVSVGTKLYVFDLSNESAPQVLQSTDLGSPVLGLTFAGGALLAATGGDTTVIEIPPTDLLAVELDPPHGGLAPPGTLIQARFTLPVSPESVTPQTFEVQANDGTGWRMVQGSREVVFAVRGSTLVFQPTVPFLPGDEVRVDLSQGIRAFDTRALAAPVHATFRVTAADALKPIIESLEPASGLATAHTTLLLRGQGFRAATSVRVGGQAAAVEWLAEDTLRVTVPPVGWARRRGRRWWRSSTRPPGCATRGWVASSTGSRCAC
ncbi:IPT/TIG domain-containing protein [Pyxidicoccus sp. 3LG]